MKKQIIVAAALMLLLTGCGGKESAKGDTAAYSPDMNGVQGEQMMVSDDYVAEEPGEAAVEYGTEAALDMAGDGLSDTGVQASLDTSGTSTSAKLEKEMLVYRGDLNIDTLNFDKSVSDFKALLNEKGGFVESEAYTDNYSTSGYYVIDETDKRNLYTATVRVPSEAYDAVMNSATGLGDVRNRSSVASNVTQQYSTYQSQLEIYEQEYKRYLSLLEQATDDEYALQIEQELFDIQIQIANLKSGITNIENDVTYSYIDITIKEVSEYEEKPAPTDTFADRFKETCKESWNAFLEVLENIIFLLIMNIYYIIIIAVVILVIRKIRRKRKQAKAAKAVSVADAEPVQDEEPKQ